MFRPITAAFAALALALVLAPADLFASGPSSGGSGKYGTISAHKTSYHLQYGTKFSHGYSYSGKNHFQWSHRCWNPTYRCYTYWDSSTSCNYYWCQPDNCFYPVSYCPYRTYCWANCYVVESIPVVQYQTVVTQTVTYRPVVQTVVTRQAVTTQQQCCPTPSGTPGGPQGQYGPGPQGPGGAQTLNPQQ